jgi:D-alanine-D-alanine ligase
MVKITDFKGVVVLYNESFRLIKGEEKDLISDQDVVKCAEAITAALRSSSIETELAPITEEAEHTLAGYDPQKWLIFNLAEGWGGKLYEEARIAWLLESRGYYFTGSCGRAIALTTNKALVKSFLSRAGLHTPDWWLLHSPDQISNKRDLPFPLFVKPVAEDASLGIGKESVVYDHKTLRDRVSYVIDHYHQSALVEEFIDGREISAAAWGEPLELLPLSEIDFRKFPSPQSRIVDYEAKWQEDTFEYQNTPTICPADLTPKLRKTISRYALHALQCTGVSNYARVDMRVTEDGVPYILEINCNPDLSPDAGFFHAVEKSGLTYPDMVRNILDQARRHSDGYSFARSFR